MRSSLSAGDDATDDVTVLAGLVSWLDETSAPATHAVTGHESPAAGYSSRTILVDLATTDEGTVREQRVVLKLPPAGPAIFDRYDFAMQAKVQEAVAAVGIPAATPATAELDRRWMGVPFLVMPLVEGWIIGQVPAFDGRLTAADPAANTVLHGSYVDLVADINRLDWRAAGIAGVVPRRDNGAELATWRAYLDWYGDGEELVPTLTSALDWCEAHRPALDPPASLLWGDVRLENLVLDDEGNPRAVLDWEMASIGAAEHDLAWLLALEATMAALSNRTVPGFLDHDACVARFESRLGRPVQDLEWYEIFAMVRSSAVMSRIAHLDERAGASTFYPVADNPILDLLNQRIDEASTAP